MTTSPTDLRPVPARDVRVATDAGGLSRPPLKARVTILVIVAVCLPGVISAQELSRWSSFCEGVEHTAGIALGDLDGDGDLDVIFVNGRHFPEVNWVFSNDGNATFYGKRAMRAEPDRSYGIALGDLTGNGNLDAVVANDAGDRSMVYRNDGVGHFTVIAGLGSGTEARRAVALGDFDGDGALDVVLVGDRQDHIYFNQDAGTRWVQRPLGVGDARGLAVAVEDLDADGYLDIIVAERGPGRIVVYRNDGQGAFSVWRTLGRGQSDPTGVATGDLDGDGNVDIVVVNWERAHAVYLGDGRGSFSEARAFGQGAQQAWSVAIGDFDLDGDLDVVVGAANLGWWSDDVDGDGTPDRFGNEARGVPSRVYINDGKGNVSPGPIFATGNDDTRPIALGDVDGDADLDVVMGNDCQPNYVFFNPVRATRPR
jgi:hypothetical protein